MTQSDFLTICQERGFFHQCTDEEGLRALLNKGEAIPAYIGFDCTAPSLHVGSLLQIMMLRWYQKCGHKPIVLMGGGTTKVGDPSGKDASRQLLDDAKIAENMAGIKAVFKKFLSFGDGASDAIMVNNDDWLNKLDLYTYLREICRYFSVNEMIKKDSVKLRLERESHLSFLEFNYMALQAFDFIYLRQNLGCRLQIGGSDQWGNIVSGVDLNFSILGGQVQEGGETLIEVGNEKYVVLDKAEYDKKIREKASLYGLTSPLITTASGAKMGKTAEGAIWLNADQCSPYDYWQFWRNTEDADVERFLKLFTELPLADIAALMQGNINDAKKALANEATTLLHGRHAAEEAAETARKVFEEGGVAGGLPEVVVQKDELGAGIPAFKLFQLAGLAESGKAARQLIKGGGARVNDVQVTEETQPISDKELTGEGYIKLSAGKKKHALVKVA